jgi:hypothetical protein
MLAALDPFCLQSPTRSPVTHAPQLPPPGNEWPPLSPPYNDLRVMNTGASRSNWPTATATYHVRASPGPASIASSTVQARAVQARRSAKRKEKAGVMASSEKEPRRRKARSACRHDGRPIQALCTLRQGR